MKNYYFILGAVMLCLTGCHKKTGHEASGLLPVDVAYPVCDSVLIYKTYPGTLGAAQCVDIVRRAKFFSVLKTATIVMR